MCLEKVRKQLKVIPEMMKVRLKWRGKLSKVEFVTIEIRQKERDFTYAHVEKTISAQNSAPVLPGFVFESPQHQY